MSLPLDVPAPVRALAGRLETAGFETWTVGGAVRDALRGSASERVDWDLATRATPRQMRRVFRRTVPLGPEHGTLGVFGSNGVMYEVTTFRRDVATDGRRATVAFADTVEEDLARRDFTVNAMAWHPSRRRLLDPHGGRRDLEQGVLRAVGDPAERFREDYLRVLRGLRFAGAFGMKFDPNTWNGLVAAVPGLDRLSRERVRDELTRVLAARRPSRALELYQSSGAMAVVMPDAVRPLEARGLALVDAVRGGRERRLAVRLAAVLLLVLEPPVSPEVAARTLGRLRFSRALTERIAAAVGAGLKPASGLFQDTVERRRWTATAGREGVRDAARLWAAALRAESASGARVRALRLLSQVRDDLRRRVPMSLGELKVNGTDLMARGWPRGPQIGAALRRLLEAVWEDPSRNEKSVLLALAGDPEP